MRMLTNAFPYDLRYRVPVVRALACQRGTAAARLVVDKQREKQETSP